MVSHRSHFTAALLREQITTLNAGVWVRSLGFSQPRLVYYSVSNDLILGSIKQNPLVTDRCTGFDAHIQHMSIKQR